MKLVLCHCRQCQAAHRAYHVVARSRAKGARSLVRRLLRRGEYARLPQRVAAGRPA